MLMNNNKRERIGAAFVIISALLFGIMPLITKVAYQHGSNAYTVAFSRFFWGSIMLLILILILPKCSIKINKAQLAEFIKISLFYALVPMLLYGSYSYIDSGLATTLHFTYPVVVVLIMVIFCKEHMEIKQIVCTILCVLGILCLYTPDGLTDVKGIVYAVLSGVAYAIYIVLLGKSKVKDLHPFVIAFWVALFSTIEIGIIGGIKGEIVVGVDETAFIMQILLALLTTVIALVLFQRGVCMCGEVKTSLLSSFEPLTGIIVGIIVFHETLAVRELIGIISVMIGVIILFVPLRILDTSIRKHNKI